MNKLNKTFLIAGVSLLLLGALAGIFPVESAHASKGLDAVKNGLKQIAGDKGVDLMVGGEEQDPDSVIAMVGNVVKALLAFLGSAFLLLIIFSGFKWMFSMGDPKKIEGARKIIFSASVGLAVIVLSYAIVSFVIGIIETGTSAGPGGTTAECPASIKGSSCDDTVVNSCGDPKCRCAFVRGIGSICQ